MPKKPIIIISVLCVISLVLGYLSGLKEEESLSNGDAETNSKKEPEFLKEGLVAYYPFNGNAEDMSGNRHDGTVNSATLVAGRSGVANKAYSFDGADDYISINPISFGSTGSWSISLWSKASGPATGRTENEKFGYLIGDRLRNNKGIGHVWDKQMRFYAPEQIWASSYNYTQWNHHVISFDGSSMTLFHNGVSKGSRVTTGEFTINSIGWAHTGLREAFEGVLDDIRIYSRALSADEVKALYEFEKAE
jgi:hypothetical protein